MVSQQHPTGCKSHEHCFAALLVRQCHCSQILVNTVFGLPLSPQAEVMHCEDACLHYQVNDKISAYYILFNMPAIVQQGKSHILLSIPVLRSAVETSVIVCCSV